MCELLLRATEETKRMEIIPLNPTFEERATAWTVAPALASLEGKTVGMLDNNKKNVGHFLTYVGDELSHRHGAASFVRRRKSNMSAPAPAEVMQDLTACDAVIVAIGD